MIHFLGTSQYDSISIYDIDFPMVENKLSRPGTSPASFEEGGRIVNILNEVKEEYKRVSDFKDITRHSSWNDAYDDSALNEDDNVPGVPMALSRNLGMMTSTEKAACLFRRLRVENISIEQNKWNLDLLIQMCSIKEFPYIELPYDEDYIPRYDDESSPLLADTYEYTIKPLVEQKQLNSILPLWQEICNHVKEIRELWLHTIYGLRGEVKRLRVSFEKTCNDKDRLLMLIQKQAEKTMLNRGNEYFNWVKEESSGNKFLIKKSIQDVQNRLKRCPLTKYFKSKADRKATWSDYVDAMIEVIKNKMCCYESNLDEWLFSTPNKIQPNEFWEFFSCALQLHILESIEKGAAVPPTFQAIAIMVTPKPHKLFDSDEAKKYWKSLIDAGLLAENRQLKPGVTDNDAAYIAKRFNETLAPQATRKEWKYFEDLWNKKGKFRSAGANKDEYPLHTQEIDKAFL